MRAKVAPISYPCHPLVPTIPYACDRYEQAWIEQNVCLWPGDPDDCEPLIRPFGKNGSNVEVWAIDLNMVFDGWDTEITKEQAKAEEKAERRRVREEEKLARSKQRRGSSVQLEDLQDTEESEEESEEESMSE